MLWALHSPEVYKWVVGLATLDEPPVPIVAPLAARPQCRRQASTPSPRIAAAIVFVAVEIPAGVPWELARAPILEDPLSGARDLKIEAVVATHIIAYVCDLDDHAFACEVRMRSAPTVGEVSLVHKIQLETLPAIGVPGEAMVPADSNRCETHAQALSDGKWLVVRARGSFASTTAD